MTPRRPRRDDVHLRKPGLDHDQLGNPPGDNAVFYYRLVLQREAGNRSALRGLEAVAERYGELAREAREKGELGQARDYVERGLDLQPDDAELQVLREEIRAAARAQRRNGVQGVIDKLFGR